MSLYIIANPHSGRKEAVKVVESIKDTLDDIVHVFYTLEKDDEQTQVANILATFRTPSDQLLILGGDGTLSKVLAHWPVAFPFAYYPVGSGNDFARSLQLPDLATTLENIQKGKVKTCVTYAYDQGVVINSLSLGIFATVVQRSAESHLKGWLNAIHLGRLTYAVFCIWGFFHQKPIQIAYQLPEDSKTYLVNSHFLAVANNTYFGGGVALAPNLSQSDDELELIYHPSYSIWSQVAIFCELLQKGGKRMKQLVRKRVSSVQLKIPKGEIIEVDGENIQEESLSLTRQVRKIYL